MRSHVVLAHWGHKQMPLLPWLHSLQHQNILLLLLWLHHKSWSISTQFQQNVTNAYIYVMTKSNMTFSHFNDEILAEIEMFVWALSCISYLCTLGILNHLYVSEALLLSLSLTIINKYDNRCTGTMHCNFKMAIITPGEQQNTCTIILTTSQRRRKKYVRTFNCSCAEKFLWAGIGDLQERRLELEKYHRITSCSTKMSKPAPG